MSRGFESAAAVFSALEERNALQRIIDDLHVDSLAIDSLPDSADKNRRLVKFYDAVDTFTRHLVLRLQHAPEDTEGLTVPNYHTREKRCHYNGARAEDYFHERFLSLLGIQDETHEISVPEADFDSPPKQEKTPQTGTPFILTH